MFNCNLIETRIFKNHIRDAHTPQPSEIVFNTMKNRRSETVQISRDSKQCQLCEGSNNVSGEWRKQHLRQKTSVNSESINVLIEV